jgi:hypothetical protein
MKLIRFATVYLKQDVTQPTVTFDDGTAPVTVRDVGKSGDRTRLLLQATVNLAEKPSASATGVVEVPVDERKEAEAAIETVANLLAVMNHTRRSISSPRPFVALYLESDEERFWSAGLSRFEGEQSGIPETSYLLAPSNEHLAALGDRLDGVALLAEALAQDHATGQFHEFIRLFERAFTLPPSQFEKKLAQFLGGAGLGYGRSEVRHWVDLRNPVTHAKDLSQTRIVLESDILPVIARMEQAAYDVLMNKKVWHNPSKERRDLWSPHVATLSPTHALKVTKGEDAKFHIHLFDPFMAFRYDAGFGIRELPENHWSVWPVTRTGFNGMITLVEAGRPPASGRAIP